MTNEECANRVTIIPNARGQAYNAMLAFIERWTKIIDVPSPEPWAKEFVAEAKDVLKRAKKTTTPPRPVNHA